MIRKFVALIGCIAMISCSQVSENTTTPDEPSSTTTNAIYIYEGSEGIAWDQKKTCQIKFCSSCILLDAEIKNRGGISSQFDKHSFSIELDEDTLIIPNSHRDNDFILNATYIDKTFLRHKLSYDIFRAMHDSNKAAHCEFRQVYLNDQYQGMYVLMEEVDKSFVGFSKEDASAILIKDGGLFSKDKENFYVQEGEDYYQQKYPKDPTEASTQTLDSLWAFLHLSADEEFITHVADYFDLQSVMDWHILLLLTNNGDGVVKNFYWHTQNKQPWRVIPWDYDDSFGRNGDNTLQTEECGWERNVLLFRLFQLNPDNYRMKMVNRWNHLRTQILAFANLEQMIQKDVLLLQELNVHQNFEKWPIDGQGYQDSATFEDEILLMEDYLKNRLFLLDTLFESWETL